MKRLPHLDSARGLAALAVVASHVSLAYGTPSWLFALQRYLPVNVLWDGAAAVLFFYVLSGFVLALPYFEGRELELGKFTLARLFRLLPAYLAFIGISLLLSQVGESASTRPPPAAWILEVMGPRPVPWTAWILWETHPIIPQGWTLVWELRYSLLIPFLILALKRSGAWMAAMAAVLWLAFGLNEYLFHFSAGVAMARYRKPLVEGLSRFPRWAFGGLLALAVFLYGFRWSVGWLPLDSRVQMDLIKGLGAAGLLACLMASPRLESWFSARPLVFIGHASYGIYLGHMAVLHWLAPPVLLWLNGQGLTTVGTTTPFIWLFTASVTTVLAAGVYYLIERPAITLGRRVARLVPSESPGATGAATASSPPHRRSA